MQLKAKTSRIYPYLCNSSRNSLN